LRATGLTLSASHGVERGTLGAGGACFEDSRETCNFIGGVIVVVKLLSYLLSIRICCKKFLGEAFMNFSRRAIVGLAASLGLSSKLFPIVEAAIGAPSIRIRQSIKAFAMDDRKG
jgi:hypothetical protein